MSGKFFLTLSFLVAPVGALMAEIVRKSHVYEIDGAPFEGLFVYDSEDKRPLPGVLFVPNWMGPSEPSFQKAEKVAAMGYIVFVADMYGANLRPSTSDEAAVASGAVKADHQTMRKRVNAALDQLIEQGSDLASIDEAKIGAIGFCFGGSSVLELVRSGRELGGVVSFHGNFATPAPAESAIKTPILVLHGAEDPLITEAERLSFIAEMREHAVDWQFVAFGDTVHSFTDPTADWSGTAEYREQSANRAFAYMRFFFSDVFGE
ncbi:MAG: dienelactone hydrolase family protein [Puniceicoccaceae bacterium]